MGKTGVSVVSVIALLLAAHGAWADQLTGTCSGITGRVLQSGLARGELQEVAKDPSGKTPAGMTWRVEGIHLVDPSHRIALAHGNMIFQSYEISGLPAGQPVQLTRVTEFPPMTGADGHTWTKRERNETIQSGTGISAGRYYWFFDAERAAFEMVPGTWTFRMFNGNCLLFEEHFEAYKP